MIDGETNAAIANARVSYVLRPQAVSGSSGDTTSGTDGTYSFTAIVEPTGNVTASVQASASGYVSTTLSGAPVETSGDTLEPILLVKQSATKGSISGIIKNARNNQPVPNADVTLSVGQNAGVGSTGAVLNSVSANAQGAYSFAQLDAGTYTVSASATDFERGQRTAIPVQTSAVSADLALSPSTLSGDIRVVLQWGASPSDLDAHLTGPNADASRFHVYFSSKGNTAAAPFAALDVDDTSSFGPETITLTRLNSGLYRFSVHDYTNRSSASSTALGASGARVDLYVPGANEARSFFVPNQRGTLWTVFELSGDRISPTVTAVNSMSSIEDEDNILSVPPREAAASRPADAAAIGNAAKDTKP